MPWPPFLAIYYSSSPIRRGTLQATPWLEATRSPQVSWIDDRDRRRSRDPSEWDVTDKSWGAAPNRDTGSLIQELSSPIVCFFCRWPIALSCHELESGPRDLPETDKLRSNTPRRGVSSGPSYRVLSCPPHRHPPSHPPAGLRAPRGRRRARSPARRPMTWDLAPLSPSGYYSLWLPCSSACASTANGPSTPGCLSTIQFWSLPG